MTKKNAPIEILVAEDSATQAEQLKFLLEEHKYRVVVAPDGRAALAQLALSQPALVISDVMMPKLDGYGLCKAIKSDEKLKHIPVMLVTTLSDPQDVIRGLECGADNFIRKPYDEKYLLSRIDYLLMNIEMRKNQRMQMALEINLGGQKHFISAERQQILDLLVSTYEQAIIVNNELKQRETELAHANMMLQGLNRIAAGLNSAVSEQEVAELALQHALELPGVQAGWIFLHSDGTRFRLAASRGLPPSLDGLAVFQGDCVCQRKLLSGELDSVTNIIECQRLAQLKGGTKGQCCHASVPLWLGKGRALGIMNLAGASKGLFSENELKVLYNVGHQVAVALERASMLNHLEHLVDERTAKLAAEVAERRRIQEAQARLVAITEATPDMVATADADGRVHYCNAAGLKLLGYRADEIDIISIQKTHPEWAAKQILEEGIPHATTHGTWSAETVIRRRDGTEVPVSQVIVAHLASDGSVEFFSTIVRDISERKIALQKLEQTAAALVMANASLEGERETLASRVEERTSQITAANEQLAQARAFAEEASRAKSAFLATMSHEIRTPMNGVIGMVDVLAQSKLTEHQIDLVSTIRESANSLLGIIEDILDFSKIEAGRLELEHVPVSIANLVDGLCNSLLPVAANKGVDLALFISPDIPELVLSDDVRLRQLLYNLIGNAIKFSAAQPGKRGQISVRVEIVQASPLRLSLRVADNGIGMSPDTVSSLFSPFTQAEISTTRRFGGTGLGLTICKRLVEMMRGEIAVESTPNAGSTFTVIVPFEVAAEQPVLSQPDLSNLECIVLESPDFIADDIRAYLAHAGARVHVIADEAVAAETAMFLAPPVVLIQAAESAAEHDIGLGLESAPHVRRVLITHGRRRRARLDGPNTVILDGDALRRLALLRAVSVAAGWASPEIIHERADQPHFDYGEQPLTIAEARAQNRLILVAEDDAINQKVILQQLAILGHTAEVAGNGAKALRMWQKGNYSLLLTDLHMPEMDGYTLAWNIRREETRDSRMPILALTANALRGEANRAQAAGMDEYLTKPLQLSALRAALEKWLPPENATAASVTPVDIAQPSGETAVVDVSVLKDLVGHDDDDTIREILSDYLVSALHHIEEMHAAMAAGDARHAGAIAHKLKSPSRSVGALALGDLCAELENHGRTGNNAAIAQGMPSFKAELEKVEKEITRLLAKDNNNQGNDK